VSLALEPSANGNILGDGVKAARQQWRAASSGSAWEWDRETGDYCILSERTPDVKWRNAELKKAMFEKWRTARTAESTDSGTMW
jgi:glycosidase